LEILEDVLKEENEKTIDGKVKWDTYNKVIDIYNNKISVGLTKKNVENRLWTWSHTYKAYKKLVD
jgi:hypothetical protein